MAVNTSWRHSLSQGVIQIHQCTASSFVHAFWPQCAVQMDPLVYIVIEKSTWTIGYAVANGLTEHTTPGIFHAPWRSHGDTELVKHFHGFLVGWFFVTVGRLQATGSECFIPTKNWLFNRFSIIFMNYRKLNFSELNSIWMKWDYQNDFWKLEIDLFTFCPSIWEVDCHRTIFRTSAVTSRLFEQLFSR